MLQETVVNQLQYLLKTSRDAKKGFAEAAEHATDPKLAELLRTRSQQRAEFEETARQRILDLGAEPFEHSTLGAALHRAWLNVRDAVAGRGDYTVVSECERGEEIAVQKYTDILSEMELPAELRALVQKQFAEVKDSQREFAQLKAKMKAEQE